tara:strand:- start:6380 stop:7582 length:1203 start_codon:yes stop_codon:yes gene_type:complete
MAGILDSKTRILDAVVTEIGRSQIANGGLRIEFASFTDASTYYEGDLVSGSTDVTSRIYFESPGTKKQDFITFETDDSGKLMGYPINEELTIIGDELFKIDSGSSDLNKLKFVSGATDFASLAGGIVTSSIDHLKELYIVGSRPGKIEEEEENKFELNNNNLSFTMTNSYPFQNGYENNIATVDNVEALFYDHRLSHLPNFEYMPPLTVEPKEDTWFEFAEKFIFEYLSTAWKEGVDRDIALNNISKGFLGAYPFFGAINQYKYEQLKDHLNGDGLGGYDPEEGNIGSAFMPPVFDKYNPDAASTDGGMDELNTITSYKVNRERKQVLFSKTSLENNIVMQMFEINQDRQKFTKLDIIDFGEFNQEDTARPNKRVFFAGKIFLNSYNIPVFVNLFTIILD